MLSFYRISGDNNSSPTDDFQVTAILSEWTENTITYNTLPAYYPHLDIDRSDGGKDNSWIDFTISDSIQEYVKDPGRNFGFMFEVYMEGRYLTVNSSEASDESLRPKLTITYDNNPVGINNTTTVLYKDIRFKNTSGTCFIYLPFTTPQTVSIYDLSGQKISSFNTNGNIHWYTIPRMISSGIHVIRITTPEGIVVKKFNFAR